MARVRGVTIEPSLQYGTHASVKHVNMKQLITCEMVTVACTRCFGPLAIGRHQVHHLGWMTGRHDCNAVHTSMTGLWLLCLSLSLYLRHSWMLHHRCSVTAPPPMHNEAAVCVQDVENHSLLLQNVVNMGEEHTSLLILIPVLPSGLMYW